jgi:CO/xanthine dehydrogenase Mo-binding subunit
LNPPEAEAQVHGGVVQGLGRAFGEQLLYDPTGQLRTATFADYELPTADLVPEIEVELVEVPSDHGPFGVRGIGEPPVVPCAPAVANAIRRATGARVRRLPITPELLSQDLGAAAPGDGKEPGAGRPESMPGPA